MKHLLDLLRNYIFSSKANDAKGLLISLFLVVIAHCSAFESIYPITDSKEPHLLKNFRTMEISPTFKSFNSHGLKEMRISGSGQFSEEAFKEMIHELSLLPKHFIVVDLREESHGFINGFPVSWTNGDNSANMNKSLSQIEIDENQRLQSAVRSRIIETYHPFDGLKKWLINKVKTEKELVKSIGAAYFRLPVTDRHRPSDETIDQLIEFIKHLKQHYWVHFHCKGGKGRTTTFLILFDIAKNGKFLTLYEILKRQYLIGGVDLTQTKKYTADLTKNAKDRIEFIHLFYRYCNEFPDYQMKWSEWVSSTLHNF